MLVSFSYLNYHTEYSAEGPVPIDMGSRACYGSIAPGLRNKLDPITQVYHIRIYKTKKSFDNFWLNFCFVDIDKYLTYVKEVFDIQYDIVNEPADERVTLNLTIPNLPGRIHNFILTNIRPLYEYPYNIALHDAIKLYESGDCPGMNIFDCFNYCLASSDLVYYGGHSCITNHMLVKPMCKKELFNMSKSTDRLNDWFPRLIESTNKVSHGTKEFVIENFINLYHRRHKIYVKNYNIISKYV